MIPELERDEQLQQKIRLANKMADEELAWIAKQLEMLKQIREWISQ